MSFEPSEAKKKEPKVATQKINDGKLGRSSFNESTVAQQLININVKNAKSAKDLIIVLFISNRICV